MDHEYISPGTTIMSAIQGMILVTSVLLLNLLRQKHGHYIPGFMWLIIQSSGVMNVVCNI